MQLISSTHQPICKNNLIVDHREREPFLRTGAVSAVRQFRQNHFSGSFFSPRHSTWNHSRSQQVFSHMTISPQEGRPQQQYLGSLGSYSHSLRFIPFLIGFFPRFFLGPSSSPMSRPRCCSSLSSFYVGSWMRLYSFQAMLIFSFDLLSMSLSIFTICLQSSSIQLRTLFVRLSFHRCSLSRKSLRRGSTVSLSCSTSRSIWRMLRSRRSAWGGIRLSRWMKSSMQLMPV